jgi:hypothetical protein
MSSAKAKNTTEKDLNGVKRNISKNVLEKTMTRMNNEIKDHM